MAKIQEQIANARKANISDQEIFQAIMKSPKYGAGFEQARAAGLSNADIAKDLGLVIKAVNNASNRRNFTPFDNTKEARNAREQEALKGQGKTQLWESGLLGMADIGVPFVQGAQWAKDQVSKGVNAVAGTNLPTNTYEGVTKTYKNINDAHNTVRKANGQGLDVTRIGANILMTAPLAAAGGTLKAGTTLASKAGAEFLGKNAAVGALIGSTGVHENNKQRLQSMGAGALGGAIGAGVGQKVGEGVSKVAQKTRNTVAKFSPTETNRILQSIDSKLGTTSINVDIHLNDALKAKGMRLSDLSDDVAKGLRADAQKALSAGKTLNPEAVARKVVLDRLGIKGTRAQITGDGKLWQQEAELAKVQGAGDVLRDKFIGDNKKIAELLDQSIAKTGGNATDKLEAAQGAIDTLLNRNAQNKEFIGSAYDIARSAQGSRAILDGESFAKEATDLLEQNYATLSLPAGIKKIIKDIEKKPQEFTLNKAEELVKVLNREYKASLQNGQPTSASYAIGVVRDALNSRQATVLQGLTGNESAQAYQFARQAHKANAELVSKIPLLKDSLKGVEPDKLFEKHILGGNISELDKTIEVLSLNNPQSVFDIKQQALEWISKRAIGQNGQPSPAGMKKALDGIGDRRLSILFTPEEVRRIKDIGMAMQYLVTQPAHSYVNNSNTSAGLMGHFGRFIKSAGDMGQYVPVIGNNIVQPLQGAANRVTTSRAINGAASLAGEARLPVTQTSQSLIDRLTQMGLIGGANLPDPQ